MSDVNLGGRYMNIIIEKDATNFIRKRSKDSSVTLLIKSLGSG